MNFLGRIKQAFAPLADEDVTNKKYVDDLAAELGARIDEIAAGGGGTEPPTPTYTVTFNMNGGGRSGGGELIQLVPKGGSAIPPGAYRSGYTFAGWDRAYTNVQADITVTALWSSSGGGGTGSGLDDW